jgi:hypothetical protein
VGIGLRNRCGALAPAALLGVDEGRGTCHYNAML